jgi:hypothetical protein
MRIVDASLCSFDILAAVLFGVHEDPIKLRADSKNFDLGICVDHKGNNLESFTCMKEL